MVQQIHAADCKSFKPGRTTPESCGRRGPCLFLWGSIIHEPWISLHDLLCAYNTHRLHCSKLAAPNKKSVTDVPARSVTCQRLYMLPFCDWAAARKRAVKIDQGLVKMARSSRDLTSSFTLDLAGQYHKCGPPRSWPVIGFSAGSVSQVGKREANLTLCFSFRKCFGTGSRIVCKNRSTS
eukprot:860453-Pelagomonas_calceolata.AAC.1